MKNVAVITGDITKSRNVMKMNLLINSLKNIFREIEKSKLVKKPFEIYRGDSFQGIIEPPENAILIAVIIRAGLRGKTVKESKTKKKAAIRIPLELLWDSRISIGIGSMKYKSKIIKESQGTAFDLSGLQLDEMKKLDDRLKINTAWEGINKELNVLTKLADAIIKKWTNKSSEVVYRYLLYKETQKEMADLLKVSQPAINKRLNLANIEALESYIEYVKKLIQKYNG